MMAEQMEKVEATKQFQTVQSDGLSAEIIELGKRNKERKELEYQEFKRKVARQEAEKELAAKRKEERRRPELLEAERIAALEWAATMDAAQA